MKWHLTFESIEQLGKANKIGALRIKYIKKHISLSWSYIDFKIIYNFFELI